MYRLLGQSVHGRFVGQSNMSILHSAIVKMRRSLKCCILGAALAAWQGCSTPPVPPFYPEGALLIQKAEPLRREEWSFNHGLKTEPPQYCIALSGGGIRSAAFSIGVLRGLHQKNMLAPVDIISAVSGGGYAAGWFYANLHSNPDKSVDDLFSDHSLDVLAGRGTFIAESLFLPLVEVITKPLGIALYHLSLLGSRGPAERTNESRRIQGRAYADAIANTFLSGRKDIRLVDLRPTIESRALPLLIVNASILEDDNSPLAWYPILEMSPLRLWGPSSGALADHAQWKNFFTRDVAYLHDALSISGAAVDFHTPSSFSDRIARFIDISLGKEFTLQDKKANEYQYVYLADGGVAENLGALALIERRCGHIYVVDAEYDPDYHFGAYVNLKRILKNTFGVKIELPKLDTMLDGAAIAAEPRGGLCKGDGCRKQELVFSGAQPVFTGTISVPAESLLAHSHAPLDWPNTEISVTYIKLSINAEVLAGEMTDAPSSEMRREYPNKRLAEYITANKRNCCSKMDFIACQSDFPQYDTKHQVFLPERMRAYFDLGEHIVEKHVPLHVRKTRTTDVLPENDGNVKRE